MSCFYEHQSDVLKRWSARCINKMLLLIELFNFKLLRRLGKTKRKMLRAYGSLARACRQ